MLRDDFDFAYTADCDPCRAIHVVIKNCCHACVGIPNLDHRDCNSPFKGDCKNPFCDGATALPYSHPTQNLRVRQKGFLPAILHPVRPEHGEHLESFRSVGGNRFRPLLWYRDLGFIVGAPSLHRIRASRTDIPRDPTVRKDDVARLKCRNFALVVIGRQLIVILPTISRDKEVRGGLIEDDYGSGFDLGVCEYSGEQRSSHSQAKMRVVLHSGGNSFCSHPSREGTEALWLLPWRVAQVLKRSFNHHPRVAGSQSAHTCSSTGLGAPVPRPPRRRDLGQHERRWLSRSLVPSLLLSSASSLRFAATP